MQVAASSSGGMVVCANCNTQVSIPCDISSRISSAAPPSRSSSETITVSQYEKTNDYAMSSFICALLGCFCGGVPLGIPAVVFAGIAKKEIARNPNIGGKVTVHGILPVRV